MITPRRIRLLRARDLAGYRSTLTARARHLDPAAAMFMLVPTSAAAAQLTRTLRERLGSDAVLPRIGSRADLYDDLRDRLSSAPRQLTPFEREAMLAAGARQAEESGTPPPFHVRPALVAEMLALYDHVRRLGRSIDDFDRLLSGELEPAADSDRGAAQLLEQTRFLAASFHVYEDHLGASDAADEHALRSQLIASVAATPLRHLVVAVGDRPFDANGFWPADVTLFTSLPGLELIDIVSTEAVLESGFEDRLRLAFVEIDEERDSTAPYTPTLVVPGEEFAFKFRDREDELEGVARRLRFDDEADVAAVRADRTGLIVARPLPYLYLAKEVFSGAGIQFEALDTLPLAAEPYAAAVDLVLECAAANFTRRALTSLLRSPHFVFAVDGAVVDRASVAALDFAMAEQRYLGGLDRLRDLVEDWTGEERTAARAALAVSTALSPLTVGRPIVDQIDLLRAFLDEFDLVSGTSDRTKVLDGARADSMTASTVDRRQRARAAVSQALDGLSLAYRRHDPSSTATVTELSAAIRRWLGSQTFAQQSGNGGVRILDAHAARFADLDDVQIMGLVEGEWPERARRNVFYPRSLIAQLEPSRPEKIAIDEERDQVRAARAVFRDLASLARVRTRVSTFSLESEAVVEPSTLLDDLVTFGLATSVEQAPIGRVFAYERLAHEPLSVDSSWARVRAANGSRSAERFAGEAGPWVLPRVSVSRLERYMKCPFQFYVGNVLQVEEEPEDEVSRSPLERGRFLHELFETFFHEWQARGRGRITAADISEARHLFDEIAGPALRSLPPAEAGLERARLFGSAVGSGIVDRVFAMEAERGTGIRERLMEYELDGAFTFVGEDGSSREVRLRAKIDRVDLLADGTFRLIDYKTKYVPDRRQALQLPIYSACVRTSLARTHGREIRASEAMYLSFEGPQPIVPLEERGKSFDELTTAAGHRLVAALDDIAAGHYPSRPETKNLCTMCAFVAVCRNPGGATEGAENTAATASAEGTDGNA